MNKILKIAGISFGAIILILVLIPNSKSTDKKIEAPQNNSNDILAVDHATTSTDDVTKITKAPVTSQPSKTIEISEIADVAQPKQSSTTTTPLEQKEEYYLVTNVVDGDTFDVSINGVTERIRLIGMDTPELKDPRKPVQCFAAEASKKATDLLLNKKVKLITDPTQDDIDKYNRLLRYAYREDGLFFNKWMIENGYAFEYTYVIPYQYQQEFKDAELYARNNLLGLWSPDTCNGGTDIKTTPTTENPAVLPPGEHKWYTSSYYSAEYYYCDTDNQWEGLSKTYLKEFNSAEELLSAYPSRTLHEPCR